MEGHGGCLQAKIRRADLRKRKKAFRRLVSRLLGTNFLTMETLLGEGRNTIMDHVVREFPSLDIPKKQANYDTLRALNTEVPLTFK